MAAASNFAPPAAVTWLDEALPGSFAGVLTHRRRRSHRLHREAACLSLGLAAAIASFSESASAKPFMDYVKRMPIVAPLSSASWGVAAVLPRDLSNGIESARGAGVHPEYYYWDGQIIRAKDGKYHLFMSTFSGNTNFGTSWFGSDAYHAVSQSNVLGPYQRQGYIYDNNGSHKGHNVTALELPDGSYAVVVSETVPFTIYKSSSLDGPWTSCQPTSQVGASNVSLFPRHDGKFQIVERNGTIAISDTLCGTYVKQKPTCSYTQNGTDSIYPKRTSIPGVANPVYTWQEDPHIWRSGGVYHVIYSGSGDRVGWHVYSTDGVTNWKDNGYAWSPREYQKIFCYEGSTTCNQWYKMERPGVVLQDGHPTHITWAVADVDKDNQVLPNSNHGTKIIVVPFDGVAFDADFGVGGGGGGAGGGGAGAGGGGAGGGGAGGGGGGSAAGGASGGGGAGGTSGAAGAGGAGGTSGTAGSGAGGSGGVGGSASGQGAGGVLSSGGAGAPAGGASANGGGPSGAGAPPAGGGTSSAGPPADDAGCGCRAAGGHSTPSSLLVFAGVVGLLRRRLWRKPALRVSPTQRRR